VLDDEELESEDVGEAFEDEKTEDAEDEDGDL
jgi:hypothetical protein